MSFIQVIKKLRERYIVILFGVGFGILAVNGVINAIDKHNVFKAVVIVILWIVLIVSVEKNRRRIKLY